MALQEAQYIPGPWLKEGKNELIILEVERSPSEATGASHHLPKQKHGSRRVLYSCCIHCVHAAQA